MRSAEASKIFAHRQLIHDESNGYFFVDPPIRKKDLRMYYENIFWSGQHAKTTSNAVNSRDLQHLNLLNQAIKRYKPRKKELTILNFGSGHGGISHIFQAFGHNIINIEPSKDFIIYNNNYQKYDTLKEFIQLQKDRRVEIDIFYSSHSLEHVLNINKAIKQIKRITNPRSIFFFEVPDADSPGNGAQTNTHDAPHTYYFQKRFFRKIFKESFCLYTIPGRITNGNEFDNTFEKSDIVRVQLKTR